MSARSLISSHKEKLSALTYILFCCRFFEYKIDLDDPRGFKFVLTPLIQNQVYTISYRILLFFVFMYGVPITILVVLNTKLLMALHEADSYRANIREKSGHKYGPKSNRSITVIVIAVVSISIVSNLTAMVSHLLFSLNECYKQLSYLEVYRRYTSLVGNVLVTFNSAVNFIIYCLFSRNFRQALVRTCACACPKSRMRHRWNSAKASSIRTQLNGTYISLVPNNSRSKMATAI